MNLIGYTVFILFSLISSENAKMNTNNLFDIETVINEVNQNYFDDYNPRDPIAVISHSLKRALNPSYIAVDVISGFSEKKLITSNPKN